LDQRRAAPYDDGVFSSILCPVDFSDHSERALRKAIDLAEYTGATLTILTVVDPFLDAASFAAGNKEALTNQTQAELQSLLARIAAEGPLTRPPAVAIAVGHAAEEILRHARDSRADLIVMGTQGLTGARRLVFGSTTDRVLRESETPVLAVPVPRDVQG
jgi:nucleotide-binding universal stress UspA family protein